MTVFLGLDLSITQTGYCIADSKAPIKYGTIDTKKKTYSDVLAISRFHKVDYIYEVIQELLFARYDNEPISYVALEGYAMGISAGKNTSLCDLAELGGIIKNHLYSRDIPFLVVPPKSLKKFITGNGNASKDMMIQAISDIYGFNTTNNNIADAYGLMVAARAQFEPGFITKEKKEILDKCFVIKDK